MNNLKDETYKGLDPKKEKEYEANIRHSRRVLSTIKFKSTLTSTEVQEVDKINLKIQKLKYELHQLKTKRDAIYRPYRYMMNI